MAKRVFATMAILALMLCPSTVRSDDKPLPSNLLGFLSPGMRVGVQSPEGTTDVLIDVYTEEHYGIARDLAARAGRYGRFVAAQTIVEAYPAIKEQLDSYVAKIRKESPKANAGEVRVIPFTRRIFGTISAVGDDYILIDQEGEMKRRRVLARSAIASINLDAAAVQFHYQPSPRR